MRTNDPGFGEADLFILITSLSKHLRYCWTNKPHVIILRQLSNIRLHYYCSLIFAMHAYSYLFLLSLLCL